jgi:membrane associated rhomboid family serine protease
MSNYSPRGFSVLPPVVKNLLILNGLFFLGTISLESIGINLIDILGLHFPFSEKFEPYQIISYMFMHGSFAHIFFNMFAVWMFGSVLENYWGPKRFIIYYLITGIGASIVHYLIVYYNDLMPTLNYVNYFLAEPNHATLMEFLKSEHFKVTSYEIQDSYNQFGRAYNNLIGNNQSYEALNLATKFIAEYKREFLNAPNVVGASGSLFGLLLAFGMLFPNSVLYLYFAFPIKAKYFVILYGAIELFAGFADKASNVAHFAHLGGMLFGFILIKLWGKH